MCYYITWQTHWAPSPSKSQRSSHSGRMKVGVPDKFGELLKQLNGVQ